jgi:putative transposase
VGKGALRAVPTIFRDRMRYAAIHTSQIQAVAVCVLPDHVHSIWALPEGDADFSTRWGLIKSDFSRGLNPALERSESKVAKRKKASGSAAIGSTQFAMTRISSVMSITFISIR